MTEPTGGIEGFVSDPADVYEALYRVQGERIVLAKDQAGQVGNQKTRYADLVQVNEVILPRLFALGLLWLTSPTLRMIPGQNGQEDPRFVLDWTLRHIPSKTHIDGTYPLMDAGTAMKAGSAITYARRYALVAITNAVAQDDDDDGRGGAGRAGYVQRASVPQVPAAQAPAETTTVQRQPPTSRQKARPAAAPAAPEPHRAPTPEPAPQGSRNDPNGPWTDPMMRKWMAQNRDAGIGKDDIKAIAADMLGRPLTSSKEITFGEMRGIIDAFEKALKDPDTAAATVIEIYHRTSGGGATEKVPTAQQAETGQPSAKRTRAAKKTAPPPARSLAESVQGIPDANSEPPPWEVEPPEHTEWPNVVEPGQQ